jgi:protoporphyrin/coproporphyrin ferrochelatase
VTTAILLTCHGTIERTEDIPAFLANIRRGRPTPAEIVHEVERRFNHIGGSPLMRITRDQAAALAARLDLPVHVAGRLWHPYPSEVLDALVAQGARAVISLPLAPQSVEVYHDAVRAAAAKHPGLTLRCVPAWGNEPALIDAFEQSIAEALHDKFAVEPAHRAAVAVVLTAHSLPRRIVESGDPYERQFREMAALVEARVAPLGNPVRVAFQSQGMTGDAWLGPDLQTTFRELAEAGVREALVAPIGFVADHVETLYDLDVEAPALAKAAGLTRFERTAAMNTRPRFIDALEALVRRELPA